MIAETWWAWAIIGPALALALFSLGVVVLGWGTFLLNLVAETWESIRGRPEERSALSRYVDDL